MLKEAEGRILDARRCYTTEEAAQVLRVSKATIHRMVQGGLRYRDVIGKGYLFLGLDLIEFLDRHLEEKVDRPQLRKVGT